ncbi:MAG: dTDP-glucose 4,6-dehydratase [Nitrospiraceae bacterium]|nr:dTDP-glucose 4,6-dehydratase [Nitrospiraceae bacterium]
MKILVTGGCGFIGSNFIRYILKKYPDYRVVNLDLLTYAGNPQNLLEIEKNERYSFIHGSIEKKEQVLKALDGVDCIVNFAAETHVDRSIADANPFLMTNIIGTYTLLEIAMKKSIKKFVHISTDEVYGSLGKSGKFTEDMPLKPNSPYSASKASADLLIRAFYETYAFPVVIVRPSNNYGYYQYPEKFIPLMITNLLLDRPIPVYGKGDNVRDWLFVEDNCSGIDAIIHNPQAGEIYNIGGNSEVKNIELARMILKIMGKSESWINFVNDRPGHDYRYALDNSKIKKMYGWSPRVKIEEGILKTVQWYKDNRNWWGPLKTRLEMESKGFWGKK